MKEVHDNTNFTINQNKFNSMLDNIKNLIMQSSRDPANILCSNLNQLFRVLMYNQLEFEFNYPKSDSLVMLQARYNLNFQDAQSFTASRYMFFKINFISILYFTLEQYSDNLLSISELNDTLKEKNFRNKFSLLLSESKVSDFKTKNNIMTVFKFLRSSFHTGGIYHGENQEYVFGNIHYEFLDNSSPELSTEQLLFLIENISNIIVDITKSEKFKIFLIKII